MDSRIQAALELQHLDKLILDLQREIAALPKHIAVIEKQLDAHVRRLEADRAALAANQKERKKLEGDIQVQEQKVSKLRDQMLGAKTNEQYRAFQHEIEFCEKEIRKAEDRILDLMGESEPLEKNVKAAQTALDQEKKQVEGEKAQARERTAADQKALAEAQAKRSETARTMEPQIRAAYDRIRKKWHGGQVVAEAVEGRCSACQIVMRPQFSQDLRRGDDIMYCESCGRILFFNPPVSFEHEMDLQPAAVQEPQP